MYQLPLSALLLATLVPLGQSIFTDGLRPCSVAPPIAPREQVSEGRTHFGSTHDQVPILQAPRYDNTTSLYIHRSFCGSLFFRLYRCRLLVLVKSTSALCLCTAWANLRVEHMQGDIKEDPPALQCTGAKVLWEEQLRIFSSSSHFTTFSFIS